MFKSSSCQSDADDPYKVLVPSPANNQRARVLSQISNGVTDSDSSSALVLKLVGLPIPEITRDDSTAKQVVLVAHYQ